MLDLSDVSANTQFAPIPPGEYPVCLDNAEVKTTKSGTGEYVNATFRITAGSQEGKKLFHMWTLKNDNAKAVEIGLSQLKAFLLAAGAKEFKLASITDLVGYQAVAVTKIRTDPQYGDKSVISFFKPRGPSTSEAKAQQDKVMSEVGDPF